MNEETGGSRFEAEYLLEIPIRCSSCHEDIEQVGVVRMLRTRVNFSSTLPRRGVAVVCPKCNSVLQVGLTRL